MVEPRVVPRAEHTISRNDIDPDALKVLYRLRQFDYTAYLVGGSVRDLLIGRRPKDFDIGTSAHPYQVKKLFRNCWIIGRRFRLAHVKFGPKVIEVATFRRQLAPGEEVVEDGVPAAVPQAQDAVEDPDARIADAAAGEQPPEPTRAARETVTDHFMHHDNTFGTPEQDAFRRDFTINALFYDIATFSVIDYVGGLQDLQARLVRSIGDPEVRFREDPVRMMRAVALAARLDFTIDPPSLDAIKIHRHEIARSSAPRLLEEYYKIMRAGAAERTFRDLARLGLLEPISEELHRGAADALWQSLRAVDAYRHRFEATPDTLTNAILLGSLIVPLGLMDYRRHDHRSAQARVKERAAMPDDAAVDLAVAALENVAPNGPEARLRSRPEGPRLGQLPLARRDIERLRQLLAIQRRMRDVSASPRARRALVHRSIFREALAWLDIHGNVPEAVEHWKALAAEAESGSPGDSETSSAESILPRRRRRRRRRRFPPAAGH
jgi:poly(A) polymerase